MRTVDYKCNLHPEFFFVRTHSGGFHFCKVSFFNPLFPRPLACFDGFQLKMPQVIEPGGFKLESGFTFTLFVAFSFLGCIDIVLHHFGMLASHSSISCSYQTTLAVKPLPMWRQAGNLFCFIQRQMVV
jgi:hypothetical protein